MTTPAAIGPSATALSAFPTAEHAARVAALSDLARVLDAARVTK